MKNYIGSGVEKFDGNIVKVSIDIEKAKQFIYEYNGKKYLTFDVAKLREIDKFGKTHSVSVWTKDIENTVNSDVKEPESNPPFSDDIPF